MKETGERRQQKKAVRRQIFLRCLVKSERKGLSRREIVGKGGTGEMEDQPWGTECIPHSLSFQGCGRERRL